MPGPSGEQCGKCYYFDSPDRDGLGSCVRYPPLHHFECADEPYDPDEDFWAHPLIEDYHWCGEFREKNATTDRPTAQPS